MKTETKEKVSIGWKLTKVFLLVLRVIFNKPAGFFANFFISIASFFAGLHYSGGYHTISYLIVLIVVYPFIFEYAYKRFWEKTVKEVHDMIDFTVYSINNNFENLEDDSDDLDNNSENPCSN